MGELPDGYPSQWETDALLKDGSTVRVRPIRPDDAERLSRFHNRQSEESIYFRFFRYRPELSESELTYFTTIDYEKRMAFVALIGDELVAVSRYEGVTDTSAEVAFFVDDQHHDRGLATLMLEYLAQRARERGIATFTATVLPQNYQMLGVFKNAGFDVSTRFDDGAIAVVLGIADTHLAQPAIDAREQRARSHAVERFFRPSSVAVVGAGRKPGSIGHELLRSILDGGFTGEVIAVNPNATEPILGVITVKAIGDHDGDIDLAIIALPAPAVFEAVERCIDTGVKAVLVVSSGLSGVGSTGQQRLRELVDLVRKNGVRMVGPLSYGVVNTDPEISLRAHFLPVEIPSGSIGLLSQSGPLGAALLNRFATENLGVSTFMSAGVRADVSVYDVLQYWLGDQATTTVGLYLENFGNPRNFVKVARHISAIKPVVAVGPGDPDLTAVAKAGGVVVVDHVSELVDQVQVFSRQPLPAGHRVVIVSNAASVASLARTACIKAGLEVVAPAGIIDGNNPAAAPGSVLIDDTDTVALTPTTDAALFEKTVVAAAVSESVDAVLLALVPTLSLPLDDLRRIVHDVDRAVAKPVVAVNLVGDLSDGDGPPTFAFPEQAANALGRMASYSTWRQTHSEPSQTGNEEETESIRAVVASLLADTDERTLRGSDTEAGELFELLGLSIAPSVEVRSARAAAIAAEELGLPVALKAAWKEQRVAGEAGGTVLDIRYKQHLRRTFTRMGGGKDHPMIVQAMQPPGAHARVVMVQSPERGSHLYLGIGGLSRSLLPPIEQIVLPADRADVDMLLAGPRIRGLLGDADPNLLRPLCERLSSIAEFVPDIAVVELNPLLVSDDGVVAVDASVTLRRWPTNPLAGVRTV